MFPTISFDAVDTAFRGFVRDYGFVFDAVKHFLLTYLLIPLNAFLQWIPPWAFLIIVFIVAFAATRRWWSAGLMVLALYAVGAFGLWEKLMSTVAIMAVSTLLCIVIGIPLGILISMHSSVETAMIATVDISFSHSPNAPTA